NAQAPAHAEQLRQLRRGEVGRVAEVLDGSDLDRPERHRVRGREFAVRLLAARDLGDDRAATRQDVALDEIRIGRVDGEARDHHRRHWSEEVRVRRLEQMRDQPRMLGLDLELDARGEEREALEKTLDVRVADLDALDAQSRRDLRELARELGADLAQVGELVAVEAKQPRVHRVRSRAASARLRRRDSAAVADLDLPGLEIDLRAQQDLE